MTLTTLLKRAPRHPLNKAAWIRQPGSFATQECRVLDVSRTGVRLEAANPFSIPENFILLFSKGDVGCHASVKWRRGTQIGAEFSSR
jgi:PilZ domain